FPRRPQTAPIANRYAWARRDLWNGAWPFCRAGFASRGAAVARDASATCARPCPRPKKSWVALLARRHAQRAVEADRLAVQHRVLDDVAHERRELARPAETRGKGDLRGERLALRLGEHREHRRVEGTGRD